MNISSPYMQEQEQQGPPSEERAHGTVSMKTYYKYFRAGGNFLFLFAIFVFLLAAEVSDYARILLSYMYLFVHCQYNPIIQMKISAHCHIDYSPLSKAEKVPLNFMAPQKFLIKTHQ